MAQCNTSLGSTCAPPSGSEAGTPALPAWRVEAPREGEPLELLLPARRLLPGRYVLVIKALGADGTAGNFPALDSYSFALERTPELNR